VLAMNATNAGVTGSKAFPATAKTLDRNSVALSKAIASVYGTKAGNAARRRSATRRPCRRDRWPCSTGASGRSRGPASSSTTTLPRLSRWPTSWSSRPTGEQPEVSTAPLLRRLLPECAGAPRGPVRGLVPLVNAPRRLRGGPVPHALALLVESESPRAALADPRIAALEEARRAWQAELERVRRTPPRIAGEVAVIRFSSPAQVHPARRGTVAAAARAAARRRRQRRLPAGQGQLLRPRRHRQPADAPARRAPRSNRRVRARPRRSNRRQPRAARVRAPARAARRRLTWNRNPQDARPRGFRR
jgi:hypothetical protein